MLLIKGSFYLYENNSELYLCSQSAPQAETPRYSNVPGDDTSYDQSYNNQTGYDQGYNNGGGTTGYDSNPVPTSSSYNNFDDQDDKWSDEWDDTSTVASTIVPQQVFIQ